jgi:aryl-alcohol dehydrogenase-like predicted oxidoreductase
LFDTADVYGASQSERFLGAALRDGKRARVIVATKFGMPMGPSAFERGGSRRYVVRAAEASLERLGTDYIDLYQIHAPDAGTPIEETLSALDDLVRAGKVRYVGHSNFSGWQIADAAWTARDRRLTMFVSAQNNYSLLERNVEREVLPACEHFGLGMLPYFPLASGLLTGKYKRAESPPAGTRLANVGAMAKRALTDRNFDAVEALTGFAAERGKTILDAAFGWLLAKPVISSVIAGATSPAQIAANVAAAEAWRFTADDTARANELTKRG